MRKLTNIQNKVLYVICERNNNGELCSLDEVISFLKTKTNYIVGKKALQFTIRNMISKKAIRKMELSRTKRTKTKQSRRVRKFAPTYAGFEAYEILLKDDKFDPMCPATHNRFFKRIVTEE
jgi:uncharacterized protein YfdQ (DUF2303 family)